MQFQSNDSVCHTAFQYLLMFLIDSFGWSMLSTGSMTVWLPHNLKCFKLFTALGVGHVLLNWLAVVTACSLLHTLGLILAYFSLAAIVFGFKVFLLLYCLGY
jgi:hypothetical protein